MQKKKQKQNNIIKQIILYTLVVIIAILLTFAEDIVKLANKNKVGLLENTPNEEIIAEPNIPILSAGMIPIKWETDHYVITTAKDNDWYDYKIGKPAYIMLNDGVYQSELVRNMETNGQKLADKNVGNDAINVPDNPNNNPTVLMWIPRFAINDETNDIKYIKDVETAEEGWTIPEMFTYKQEKETAPDFLLTGIWFEKDVDTSYTSKINQMNQEESIYGFIANTKAVASDQTTGNTVRNYYNTLIANIVGNDALVVPSNENTSDIVGATDLALGDPTNPNRIILKIINQKNQDPIKAKASYNKDTGLIEVQVTYSQYGISKILLENEHELNFRKVNGITTADTTGIELEDGINAITIIDNNGNKKELKVQVMSAIYATLYTDGTLAFGKSENSLPEKTIWVKYGDISGKDYIYTDTLPWKNERTSITTVNFVNKISPISTQIWFWQCSKLENIENMENLNTKNVANMRSMFNCCSSLTNLDLSNFNTSNVTNMNYMFYSCSELTSIDLSNFDTSNVTDMAGMFRSCTSLTGIDLSSFDTSNVTDVSGIFADCTSLTQISFGEKWNKEITLPKLTKTCTGWYSDKDFTNKVAEPAGTYTPTGPITIYANVPPDIYVKQYTDGTLAFCSNDSTIAGKTLSNNYGNIAGKEYITVSTVPWYNNRTSIKTVEFVDKVAPISTAVWFSNCTNLTAINNISNLNTNSVTNMNSMFQGCSSLTSLDVSNFDTSNVTNMQYMFAHCKKLTNLNVSNFDTSKVVNMHAMFYYSDSLTSLDLSNFDTRNVTDIGSMFEGCSALTSLNISSFDTSNATIMQNMFANCNGLTSLDVTHFNTSNVTNMGGMFQGCSLTSLDVGNFDTSKVTTMQIMFNNCNGLTSLDLSNFDTSNVTSMNGMFNNCTSLTNIDVSTFETNNVTDMDIMFSGCSNLTSLDVSNFNTTNVTDMDTMFSGCSNLTTLDVSNFNTTNVTDMHTMFSGCSNLSSIDLSNFDTSKVTDMRWMFYNCKYLNSIDLSNFDTKKVTDMSYMFYDCTNLKTIYVGANWKLATKIKDMFKNCGTSKTTTK